MFATAVDWVPREGRAAAYARQAVRTNLTIIGMINIVRARLTSAKNLNAGMFYSIRGLVRFTPLGVTYRFLDANILEFV